MRRAVIAVTHAGGGGRGVNVNILTDRFAHRDPINEMPVLIGFAVGVRKVRPWASRTALCDTPDHLTMSSAAVASGEDIHNDKRHIDEAIASSTGSGEFHTIVGVKKSIQARL
jgi:hypothetical protein